MKVAPSRFSVTELAAPLPTTLLRELNHRINNEFASAISQVSVAAVRTDNVEVKSALSNVVELLHQYAGVHRALRMPDPNVVINAADYLRALCHSLNRSKLEGMGIRLVFSADAVWLESERCWRLGMMVYELVSNAARHAFWAEEGEIRVELSRARAFAKCKVSDDGTAVAGVRPGRGLRIIGDLATSLGGRIDHSNSSGGRSFALSLPFSGQEHRANRSNSRSLHWTVSERSLEGPQHAQL
ncbi:two-component sensor histidine kinase [Nitrobacteraceae bacterium AZCC 2161]